MLTFTFTLLRAVVLRGRGDAVRDRGASALEWAIIAAVVVVAASIVGGAVYTIVQDKSQSLSDCAGLPPGSVCN